MFKEYLKWFPPHLNLKAPSGSIHIQQPKLPIQKGLLTSLGIEPQTSEWKSGALSTELSVHCIMLAYIAVYNSKKYLTE